MINEPGEAAKTLIEKLEAGKVPDINSETTNWNRSIDRCISIVKQHGKEGYE